MRRRSRRPRPTRTAAVAGGGCDVRRSCGGGLQDLVEYGEGGAEPGELVGAEAGHVAGEEIGAAGAQLQELLPARGGERDGHDALVGGVALALDEAAGLEPP